MSKTRLLNDDELVASLAAGSDMAFSEIYERYWKRLLGIAYKHTKDKSLAEEIVQEVFISLWNRRNDVAIQSLDAYLATAIKFAAFKSMYRERRHSEIVQTNLPLNQPQLDEEQIDAHFLKEYLDGVIEKLPEKCRLVFRYSREEYKTNAEIARDLSISEKAVEANITRALKTIRLSLRKASLFSFIYLFF